MAISLNTSPGTLHSSGNDNWWVFQSTLRIAPRFNLKVDVLDDQSTILNSLLIPSNPDGYNILNIKNIINDYCLPDFNIGITGSTINNDSYKKYKLNAAEYFQGFYITASSIGGLIGTVSVIGNGIYTGIATPSSVAEIGFAGGSVTTPTSDIWVINYGTASSGFINRFNLSRSSTQSIGVTAAIGSDSPGYLILNGYTVYSTGATYTSSFKWAAKSNFEYLDYDSSDNYSLYTATSSNAKFLTNAPLEQDIQPSELATLTYVPSATATYSHIEITDNNGKTYSIATGNWYPKIDIPTGTKNLNIATNSTWYDVVIKSGTQSMSETRRYNIRCLNVRWTPVRLCWYNNLGGVDYYTFKFIGGNSKKIDRSNFDKNMNWGYTNETRGISTYKLSDYDQWTVVSELLDDEESEWLSDLFTSKDVFWIKDDNLIPVTLTADGYERNVGLENNQLEVTYRLSRGNIK